MGTVDQDASQAERHLMTNLAVFLQAVIDESFQGVQQRLADAIQISSSRLGRILKGEFSPNVVTCLRLAKVTGHSASDILRMAGKSEVAELIEALYGQSVASVPDSDRQLLKQLHALEPESRQLVIRLVNEFLSLKRHGKQSRRSAAG